MRLERTRGPECPNCGCTDGTVIHQYARWGKPVVRVQCSHCGNRFAGPTAEPEESPVEPLEGQGVVFRHGKTTCPECESTDTLVKSTRVPIRHHKCRACGARFKSSEG